MTDPGRKNVSNPSPKSEVSLESAGRNIGLVGALVLARLGRPLTKCCSCWPTDRGSSATESRDSVTQEETISQLEMLENNKGQKQTSNYILIY